LVPGLFHYLGLYGSLMVSGLDVFLDVICQEGLATYRECIG
jgi:hypothetical protein